MKKTPSPAWRPRTQDKRLFRQKLLAWFEINKRDFTWRKKRSAYRVWIAELMLQQTRTDQATPYFQRFIKRFPSLRSLATSSQQDVLKVWEGLGYYSRARNLHKAAQLICTEYGGRFPKSYQEMLSLPGIGPYTAAAIASLVYNEKVPVMDGNVIRVVTRYFAYGVDSTSSIGKKEIFNRVEQLISSDKPGMFNEALMELGATCCLPRNPSCSICPLKAGCQVVKQGADPHAYPKKPSKAKIPTVEVGAGFIRNKKGEILIAQRKQTSMLGGLWEFPGGKIEVGESVKACVKREFKEELGIVVELGEAFTTVEHVYSHFKLRMHVFEGCYKSGKPRCLGCDDWAWVKEKDLRRYPFPKADLKVIEQRGSGRTL